jgi:hypothetical protein
MAKQKFTHYVPRPKPRKRPGRHTKSLNKNKKRDFKNTTVKVVYEIYISLTPV